MTNQQQTLADILGSAHTTAVLTPEYHAKPLAISPGSDQERLVLKAARQIQSVAIANPAFIRGSGEQYADACTDTFYAMSAGAAAQTSDPRLADIIATITRRALIAFNLKPITESAKVEVARVALAAATAYRSLFAEQLMLEAA